jgi:uncharacterized protein YidB (DUF937 family)
MIGQGHGRIMRVTRGDAEGLAGQHPAAPAQTCPAARPAVVSATFSVQILGGGGPGRSGSGRRSSGLGELSDIVERFDRSGQGEIARSWVGPGENRPALPGQISAVLDTDTLDQLQAATGIDKDEILAGLAQTLPGVVDRLTPQGRLPTREELQRYER